jgi:hypothetical protein
MKILKNSRYQFVIFLLLFFVINVLQGRFTALFEDEAYYWVWSKNLAFGYFDHPPMVALWVKLGELVFNGELGLRFMSTLGFALMVWIIWDTIELKEKWQHVTLFYLLIVSMALMQAFGFIITPDTPLLLFTALFLWSLKRFLDRESLLNTLLLGCAMAGMLYSKYHGILVIGFVVISHWKLLKSGKFWMAGILGLLLFIPHLLWQYDNDFPSFIYHLKERSKKPYKITNTLSHFLNMIAIVGLTFPVIYKAFIRQKAKDQFQRSLKFIVYGFFVFFLFTTFTSKPQAQWLVVISIPLILITFPYFVEKHKARKWLVILGSVQLGVLLIARVFIAFPDVSPLTLEPHLARQWIPELQKNTKGKPIVFVNSYRNASLYNFYTGIQTHSYSVLKGRQSQYNLLEFEAQIQGKDVYSAGKLIKEQPKLAQKQDDLIQGRLIHDYHTFEKVKCIINEEQLNFRGGKNKFEFHLTNTYAKNINFERVRFIGVFQGYKNKILAKVPLEIEALKPLKAYEDIRLNATFEAPELNKQDKVTFRVALEFYDMLEGFQGNKVPVLFDVLTKND